MLLLLPYLLSLGRPLQLEEGDVVDEGGVVEAGVDDDVGDVELLVAERLGRRAHVVLAQANLQDVADPGDERETGKKNYNFKCVFMQ